MASIVATCCLVALFCLGAEAQFMGVKGTDAEYDPNPQYAYSYSVADPITGDSKSQHESRQGDVVQGSYSLVEADGSLRTVEYNADPVNGFNAVVSNSATGVAAAPAVKAAVPAYKPHYAAAPVAYGAYPYSAHHAYPYSAHHAAPYSAYHAAPYSAHHAYPYSAYHASPYTAHHAYPYSAHNAYPYSAYHASPYAAYRKY